MVAEVTERLSFSGSFALLPFRPAGCAACPPVGVGTRLSLFGSVPAAAFKPAFPLLSLSAISFAIISSFKSAYSKRNASISAALSSIFGTFADAF
uniref:Putative secreted protein n=1 Tax=Anopheles darlingi TaxID=43151 RepID=A0A2M4DIY7_ANODA